MGIFGKAVKAFGTKYPQTTAIILCAGASTRFGKNKQMAKIRGKGVAERTVAVFDSCDAIKEIVLVVPKEETDEYQEMVLLNDFKKVKAIVTGGETRQISAMRGLNHVSPKAKFVAIHDGARCLVTDEIIKAVLSEAVQHRCACAATQITDTVKLSDENGFIKRTVDRNVLWSAQTPQIFNAEIYKAISYNAKQKGIEVTDDCMLAEAAGFKVKLVDTGNENIKITHPSDIILAEQIIAKREDENL